MEIRFRSVLKHIFHMYKKLNSVNIFLVKVPVHNYKKVVERRNLESRNSHILESKLVFDLSKDVYASYLSLCFKRKMEDSLKKASFFLLLLAMLSVILAMLSSGLFIVAIPHLNDFARIALVTGAVIAALVSTGFAIFIILLIPSLSAASCKALKYAWPRAYNKTALKIDPNGMTWVGRMCKYYFVTNKKISNTGIMDETGLTYVTSEGFNSYIPFEYIQYIMIGKDIIVIQPKWAENMEGDIVFYMTNINVQKTKTQIDNFMRTLTKDERPEILF